MKNVLYFGRKPWKEVADARELARSLVVARTEIESMFAEARMAYPSAYERKSDGSYAQHVVICNGVAKREGCEASPLPADWLTDTKATIAELYPDHANMRLVWRRVPEYSKWDATDWDGYHISDAGEAYRIRIHAEPLDVHPVYEDDLNNVQGY